MPLYSSFRQAQLVSVIDEWTISCMPLQALGVAFYPDCQRFFRCLNYLLGIVVFRTLYELGKSMAGLAVAACRFWPVPQHCERWR